MLPNPTPASMALVFFSFFDLPSEGLDESEVIQTAEALLALNSAFRTWADEVTALPECPEDEIERSEFVLERWDDGSAVSLSDFLVEIGALPEDAEEGEREDWGDDLAPFGRIGWK